MVEGNYSKRGTTMGTQEIVVAIIFFVLSLVLIVLSIRHFLEKGFLFNNAYLYASKEERQKMNKKPYYRQSAIVLLILGISFAFNGIQLLTGISAFFVVEIILFAGVFVYAIISSILIDKRNKAK